MEAKTKPTNVEWIAQRIHEKICAFMRFITIQTNPHYIGCVHLQIWLDNLKSIPKYIESKICTKFIFVFKRKANFNDIAKRVYQQGFSAVLLTMNIDFKSRILANQLSRIKRYTQPKYVNCQIPRFVCVSVIST